MEKIRQPFNFCMTAIFEITLIVHAGGRDHGGEIQTALYLCCAVLVLCGCVRE